MKPRTPPLALLFIVTASALGLFLAGTARAEEPALVPFSADDDLARFLRKSQQQAAAAAAPRSR